MFYVFVAELVGQVQGLWQGVEFFPIELRLQRGPFGLLRE